MDKKLFVFINNMAGRSESVDKVMIYASNEMRYIYPTALIFLWIAQPKNLKKNFFLKAVLATIVNLCLNFFVKKIKYRPRPFIIRHVNVLLPSKLDSSYISKHSLLAYSISTFIFLYNKVLGKYMFLLSTVMGISRVWVGAHYPLDVIRGGLLGTVTSLFISQVRLKNN